ncbi:unnamed protein product [Blepharisma stoltei]|uniref:Uncharacterized protein n=1 Tax=Blepharisma stoltei TaxID=1481888 RepID=A0AAU9IGF6_9CILI|nr:unnamed protein product [Blepharisma stoltei]
MGSTQLKEPIRFTKIPTIHIRQAPKISHGHKNIILNEPPNTEREPKLLTLDNYTCIRCKSSSDLKRPESGRNSIIIRDEMAQSSDSNLIENYEQTLQLAKVRRKNRSTPVSNEILNKIEINHSQSRSCCKEDFTIIQSDNSSINKFDHHSSTTTLKLLSPSMHDKKPEINEKSEEKKPEINGRSEEKPKKYHRRVFSDGNAENLIAKQTDRKFFKSFASTAPGAPPAKMESLHVPKISDVHIRLRGSDHRNSDPKAYEDAINKSTQNLHSKNKIEKEWVWRGKHGLLPSLSSKII